MSILGLVAFIAIATPLEVVSQSTPPCEDETVVVTGTKMSVDPEDPWIYECMGTFTNCTDVWVVACQE